MMQPESIILAFANIGNQYLDDLYFELSEIRDNALKNAVKNNDIKIIENIGGQIFALTNLLSSEQGESVTMLHYSGHSSKEGLFIPWLDKKERVNTELLAELFKIHNRFRFIFLNSCYSENVAIELIKAGVPYVIGTTDKINDRQAAIVAGQFYHYLAKKNRKIKDAFTLTKIHFSNPSYNDNEGIKQAFRSFVIPATPPSGYPWYLFENPELKEEDKNWVLVSEKPALRITVISSIVIAAAVIIFFLASHFNKNTSGIANTNNGESPPLDTGLHDSGKITANDTTSIKPPVPFKENENDTSIVIPPAGLQVSGNVFDINGKPLSEVSIIVNGVRKNVITDHLGRFHFKFKTRPVMNEYRITFFKEGYQPKPETYFELPKENINQYLTPIN